MKSKFLEDFKAFASKGNAIDMAVGVILGAAFGKIVSSLVDNIIMPLIGVVIGGINFTDLKWVIVPEHVDAAGKKIAEVSLGYGMFIQTSIDFLIIAFSIFCFITLIGKFTRKKEEAPKPAPVPTPTEVLLTEIRDILKEEEDSKK